MLARRFIAHLNHFRVVRKSIQRIKKADVSDTTDLRETARLLSEAFRNVYKADDHHPGPMIEANQQVNQMAALAFTPASTRSILGGVHPQKAAKPDGVHHSLVRILADVLLEPITALFNPMPIDGIPADWKKAEVIPLDQGSANCDVVGHPMGRGVQVNSISIG